MQEVFVSIFFPCQVEEVGSEAYHAANEKYLILAANWREDSELKTIGGIKRLIIDVDHPFKGIVCNGATVLSLAEMGELRTFCRKRGLKFYGDIVEFAQFLEDREDSLYLSYEIDHGEGGVFAGIFFGKSVSETTSAYITETLVMDRVESFFATTNNAALDEDIAGTLEEEQIPIFNDSNEAVKFLFSKTKSTS